MTAPTQKQSETLKPCPFCGYDKIDIVREDMPWGILQKPIEWWNLRCNGCLSGADYPSKDGLIKKWNARVERAQPTETPVAEKVREAKRWLDKIQASYVLALSTIQKTPLSETDDCSELFEPVREALELLDQQAATQSAPKAGQVDFEALKQKVINETVGKFHGYGKDRTDAVHWIEACIDHLHAQGYLKSGLQSEGDKTPAR